MIDCHTSRAVALTLSNVQRLSRDLLLHVRKEARCRELADERLFGRLCHDAQPVAKKVDLHTMSMEFTAVSLLLLVEGLPAGRRRLVPCVSNLDDQRCHFALSATTDRDRGFADSLLEGDGFFRFRASGDTPYRPRGEAASHRSRFPLRRDPPSGRDLDDGTVSQLLEELAGRDEPTLGQE